MYNTIHQGELTNKSFMFTSPRNRLIMIVVVDDDVVVTETNTYISLNSVDLHSSNLTKYLLEIK